jgi:hypothetical protein
MKKILPLIIFLFSIKIVNAQLILEKWCSDNCCSILVNKKSTITINAFAFFEKFNDSTKILLIRKLLTFRNDTTKSFISGVTLNPYISSLPLSIKSTIQIEALVIINQIVLGKDFINHSPFGILIDTCKRTINTPELIGEVYNIYEKWFEGLSKNSEPLFASFPLLNHRFCWYKSSSR